VKDREYEHKVAITLRGAVKRANENKRRTFACVLCAHKGTDADVVALSSASRQAA
jgi:hypothetical protein